MKIGNKRPNLKLEMTGGNSINLSKLGEVNTVVYFYPKDSTPGCTTEGLDFSERHKLFKKTNTEIYGVSRDTIKSHENFKEKQSFTFELISDPDEKLCNAFDVIKLKKLYGREYMGIERSTFLFDKSGKLVKEWRKVKVKGHAEDVLMACKELA